MKYSHGWIAHDGATVFLWTSGLPCYLSPFSLTNVPIGIDGLEFV